jgi:hexosaminidase
MLDVSRHFFTVKEVKQFVDMLALYKLNTLHLHLSDDQGWRIQIDSWPKLTTVGGASQVGGGPGGFYTKADYAEIVRYAQERFITVVPEIDMPAHTHAAIAAYPELGCSRPMPEPSPNAPPGFYSGIRVGWSALCHDKEVVFKFADDVIRELAAMTPGPFLHVGGDEVEVLTHDQYVAFMERLQDIVYKYGKTMVGWQEVGTARMRPTSIVQQWRSDTAPPAVRQGSAKLILSPATKVYLDMKYTPTTELGLRWAGFVSLKTSYDWEPTRYAQGAPVSSVLGVEAPLWSETIENIGAALFLAMPRLPAVAEVGWSDPERKDWESFRTRISAHAPRWRLLGVNYHATPEVVWELPFQP